MSPDQQQSLAAQHLLRERGHYHGRPDGDWGPLSRAAARAWHAASAAGLFARMPAARRHLLTRGTPSNGTLRNLAAQVALHESGHYTGAIDAAWGPLSQSAAAAWQSTNAPASGGDHRSPSSSSLDSGFWNLESPYQIARRHIGTREIPGSKHNPVIVQWLRRLATWVHDDETPWCSAFVDHCAREAGYESTGKLNARSWLDVGDKIHIRAARQGDVVIFSRGNPDGWQGHVGFIDSIVPNHIRTLGGNQSDSVNISSYPKSSVLGIRRLRTLDSLQGPSNKI